MLDLTGRPAPMPIPEVSAAGKPTLADVCAHVKGRENLSPNTRARYVHAVEKAGERLNRPLHSISAELALVEHRFPLDGFDPDHWSTNAAYELFRRRLQAALREFLGVHAEKARLRAMEDDWSRLLEAIEPLTKGRVGTTAKWHPMKLEAMKSFALVARAYGWQPRDLGPAEARRIDGDFRGNKREANARSIRRLDELRAFPELLQWLPAAPVNFTAEARVPLTEELSPAWEAQFCGWIDAVTKSGWDPVDQEYADDHEGHAHVMRSAFRTMLRIARGAGLLAPDEADLRRLLADDEILCVIAGEMFARRQRSKREGHLEPRTARKYLSLVNQVRAHLGIDTTVMTQVLKNNAVAREGKKADKRMTPANRAFCERLVESPAMRRRFLGSFEVLRAAADDLMSLSALEGRELTPRERARVRLLGVSACFAAIEIGGAPIRVENAMGLTCVGEDAQIRIPRKGRKPMRVLIPEEFTKNDAPIEFPIRSNGYGYYDTIRWYLDKIRPLFPHAEESPYLFPAVTAPGAHLDPSYFGAEFAGFMRTVVNFPMTPHQMRHGQTSLLLNRYPNELEVIAKRIGDTADTLRRYYGWLNALKLVERGQDLLVGLMDD